MAQKKRTERVRNVPAAAERSCSTADHGCQEPSLRLVGVRPMNHDEQRRFDLLVQSLLRHWVERGRSEEGNHGSQATT